MKLFLLLSTIGFFSIFPAVADDDGSGLRQGTGLEVQEYENISILIFDNNEMDCSDLATERITKVIEEQFNKHSLFPVFTIKEKRGSPSKPDHTVGQPLPEDQVRIPHKGFLEIFYYISIDGKNADIAVEFVRPIAHAKADSKHYGHECLSIMWLEQIQTCVFIDSSDFFNSLKAVLDMFIHDYLAANQ